MKKTADAIRLIVFIILSSLLYWGLVKLSFPLKLLYNDAFVDGFLPNVPLALFLLLRLLICSILFGAAAVLVGRLNPSNKYSRVAAHVLFGVAIILGVREIWTNVKYYNLGSHEYYVHHLVVLGVFLIVAVKVNARLNRGRFA
jgi:hypothetical protein